MARATATRHAQHPVGSAPKCGHELCMSKHGKNSAKTIEAATNRAKEQRTYDDTVALMARIAETMLAAGTAK